MLCSDAISELDASVNCSHCFAHRHRDRPERQRRAGIAIRLHPHAHVLGDVALIVKRHMGTGAAHTKMLSGGGTGSEHAVGAGAAPIIYGLLSDLFPPRERPFVTTCVVISQGAGSALGQAIAGGIPGILPSNLDWRMPFVLVSVPALIVAAITAYTTEDPARGAAEPALRRTQELEGFTYDEHLSWRKLRTLCGTPTNLLIIFQVRNLHLGELVCWTARSVQRHGSFACCCCRLQSKHRAP